MVLVSAAVSRQGGLNGASSFNQPLNKWNVSNVTDMWSMFNDARAFNQPLNNWNVSNVTNMYKMFFNASSFNQPLNNWNVSKVTYMYDMFEEATSFNQPLHAPWYVVEQSDSLIWRSLNRKIGMTDSNFFYLIFSLCFFSIPNSN